MADKSKPLREQVGGRLNPAWVEWLMGWPQNWTSLEPLDLSDFDDWMIKNDKAAEGTTTETVCNVWGGNGSTKMEQREIRQHIPQSPLLQFGVLRESKRVRISNQDSITQESAEGNRDEILSELRICQKSTKTPSEHSEPPRCDCLVSDMPHGSRHEAWEVGTWWTQEPNIERLKNDITDKASRIKAIGNGQVPAVVRAAWYLLMGELDTDSIKE